MPQFTHLHVHTQYSILDGASNIKKLIEKVKALGMDSIAITDHGNMFGVKNFHEIAVKNGIKPIIGCECYLAKRTRHDKIDKIDRSGHHLILLAKNKIGYQNLIKLSSLSYTEGYYYRPRIDKEILEKHSEGLICTSACLAGEVQQAILSDDLQGAKTAASWYKSIFGDDFYLELQLFKSKIPGIGESTYREQSLANKELLKIGEELNIKCIASNDVHFINAEDAIAHDHLICLNTGSKLEDQDRLHYTGEEYLKNYDEMLKMFPHNENILLNTQEIANKIEHINLDNKPFMPDFPIPEEFFFNIYKLKNSYKKCFDLVVSRTKDEVLKSKLSDELDGIYNKIDSCETAESLNMLVNINENFWHKEFCASDNLPIAKQFIYLEHITYQGAKNRYGELDQEKQERIEFELTTIENMGFPGYFLIVWDFIKAAKDMDVSVGPGRGSAAGSVVAYCLQITNIDPLKYHLLFERFLNPERISMPDIDIDFDEDGREKVMQYVVDKYGKSRVAHIITFGKMGAKNAIRDVARVQQLPLPESDRLSKLVPEKPGITLQEAFDNVPELKNEQESKNPLIRNTLQYANTLEGSVRQTGVHACGIIIGKGDLENFVPISTSTAPGISLNVVQYDGHYVESIGLLKMDFLGLRTLSIIKDCVKNVKASKGVDIDIDHIPLDDKLTFELYSKGDTSGIFQFESPGMKKYLRSLKPDRLEDLIAMNALYRPGPLEFIPDFIARKKGEMPIEYDMPGMEVYLEETYGITVYQEQVMLLSQLLAGFSKGQADRLRKAMGKKIKSDLDKLKDDFINGAAERGHDKVKCEAVWKKWEAFASYAFNKSHSTCYAYLSYQTAYLKAHYPSEFMATLLSRNSDDTKKVSFFMDESSKMGRPVKGPDVNLSRLEFSVDSSEDIRFGLSAIKGIGVASANSIIEERAKNGEFKDIFDFIERIDFRTVGKKSIENLVDAGAFDSLGGFPRFLYKYSTGGNSTFFDKWMEYGISFKDDAQNLTNSLFGDLSEEEAIHIYRPEIPEDIGIEHSKIDILKREKELIGMFVSAHPLDDFKYLINKFAPSSILMLEEADKHAEKSFSVAGIVEKVQILPTKSGTNYCRLTLLAEEGSYEFVLFKNDFEKYRNYYYPDNLLCISGRIAKRFDTDNYKPLVQSIVSLQELNERIDEIEIIIDNSNINSNLLNDLDLLFSSNTGDKRVSISIYDLKTKLKLKMISSKHRVDINSLLIRSIEKMELKYKII